MVRKKYLKRKHTFFAALLLLLIIMYPNTANAQDQYKVMNILILNSYHQGLTWSKEEANGIVDTLLASGDNIIPLVEYMDWKNYPSRENIDYLYQYYKFKYQNKKIDMILTTDDAALEFALNNREELFSDAPVVFCGVNQSGVASLTKGYDRVTGVVEVIDPTDTLKAAKEINPSIKNIYLVYDNSESGTSTGRLVSDKIRNFDSGINIIPCNDMEYEQMIRQVGKLDQNSIVLLTTYYSDGKNRLFDMEYVIQDVSANSSVPVYELYDFGLNRGTIGGAMLSGRMQGENAATLALRILKGESIANIPVIAPESRRKVFDYQQLQRFRIPISKLPKEYELINRPFSFFETYQTLVISVLSAFVVAWIFIAVLLFYIRRIRRMKKELSDNHEELVQLYEELTASDEEMRQQYDEILSINEKIRIGEEKLAYLAYFDSLTGLPNKLSLYENANYIFVPGRGKSALLFIDIDNFKYVNDAMGHAFGDQLIIGVCERIKHLAGGGDHVYRLSGDEFILILENTSGREAAQKFASEILLKFNEEFCILDSNLHISLSIGIVLYPEHSTDFEQLLKYADIAMYRAKEKGKKNYVVYDESLNEVFTERVSIEKYLHTALEHDEFEVYYQPQLDLKAKKITGFEALLRWKSPVLGNVSPLKFIQVAEDTHLIIPLGTWVLRKACMFLKQLHDMGHHNLMVSVNVSILQLLQADFYEIVDRVLDEFHLEPASLELEITESIFMESFDSIVTNLEHLSNRKIRIALDDFGKGYSSLNYLKQLPITTLKVDKTFIDNIVDEKGDTLTGHIVTIGKSMGLCVVAEGVEKQEQLDYLQRHDCDKIQGFLYSRPIREAELISLLKVQQ